MNNSAADLYPHLIAEWDNEKNELKLSDYKPGSNFNAWWRCAKDGNHKWHATIAKRTLSNQGCPYCTSRLPSPGNNLRDCHPEVAAEWYYELNDEQRPEDYLPKSAKKAWWRCPSNPEHEYLTAICSRTASGSGCPYCAGTRVHPTTSLENRFPEVAESWHPTKNGNKTPSDVTWGTNRKFHWVCEKNPEHIWKTSVVTRTSGNSGCPICRNFVLGTDNSLAIKYPYIADSWHSTKNGNVKPTEVVAGGSKKFWWQCDFGHEWKTSCGHRINGSGCPKCSNQTSRLEIRAYVELRALLDKVLWRHKIAGIEVDIYLQNHNLAIEVDGFRWHENKLEKDKEKNSFFESQGLIVIRLREVGLEQISPNDITYKQREDHSEILSRLFVSMARLCSNAAEALLHYSESQSYLDDDGYRKILSKLPAPPIDQSLAETNPESKNCWDYEKNSPLSPEMFLPRSNKNVYWRCGSGHSWEKAIDRWHLQPTCPVCKQKDNCLQNVYPEIAATWHTVRNGDLSPGDVTKRSNKVVWWICAESHEWQASVAHRTKPRNCPECSGKKAGRDNNLAVLYPDVAKEWHLRNNGEKSPEDYTYGSAKKVWWQCPVHNTHVYHMPVKSRTSGGCGCPYCAGKLVSQENSFATKCPELCNEWSYLNNQDMKPEDFTYKSGKIVWWSCQNGHEWQDKIIHRTRGKKCPRCVAEQSPHN